jgi:hypothetical protein
MINKAILFFCLSALPLTMSFAQNASQEIRVKQVKATVAAQMTPNIQAQFVTEKRWKPKTWIEIDTEFEVELAQALGGELAAYGSLEFKYYLATSARDKDGKTIVMSGAINHVNIPAGDNRALAYVSPSALRRALSKEDGGKNDVIAYAVAVSAGGTIIAGDSSVKGKWWEDTAKFAIMDGLVVAKAKTPFSVLWGDYDVQTDTK